ncbi:MAG: GNAT family N-acetyltransferase [Candidatus Krumholzibacteriota bacterium]|nr:GNAT family N-acetyltransferase [Candidatus Krumholzibacteriota bacterium]
MKVRIQDNINGREILDFIGGFPRATFFHTPAWMEILTASFPRFRPAWITVRDDYGLRGMMPFIRISRGPFRSLWALPFGTYGGPLADQPATGRLLLEEFSHLTRSPFCLEAEVDFFPPPEEGSPPAGMKIREEECSLITLEGNFDDYLSRMVSKKKRQICNGCRKSGMEVRTIGDEDEIDRFHDLYRLGSRSWGGVHPYPLRLFKELFRRREEGVVFLGAYRDGELLGGHINLFFGRTAQAWQAGISPRSHELGVAAYLVLHAVKEAYQRNTRYFNLGSSGGDQGMIFFKRTMGGSECRYPVIEFRNKWWSWLRTR